jgi:aryl-alcohol dehydrogenase-like predicted oxidoreductase
VLRWFGIASVLALGRPSLSVPAAEFSSQSSLIPLRPFGNTGVKISALGFGGAHWAYNTGSKALAIRLLHAAIEAGVTFVETAWEYADGQSEIMMGEGLQGRRTDVFLMTKVCTHGRNRDVAMRQLEESLRRLRTDYIDLWQIHEISYADDTVRHTASGGTVDALLDAKRQGKVRFIGFTGHKDPHRHLEMLATEVPFDACQLPLNPFDATYRSFEQEVLPVLVKRGIAPLAMKTLCGDGAPVTRKIVTPEECLRYALSLPVASVISGIDSLEVLRQNLEIVGRFTPMNAAEMQALRMRVAPHAADGRYEIYKTTRDFDSSIGQALHALH